MFEETGHLLPQTVKSIEIGVNKRKTRVKFVSYINLLICE